MSKADMYVKFLNDEGYRPEVDSDGDVRFKSEGGTYFVFANENDQQFFQLVFPAFWSIDNDAERRKVLVAADHATQKTKVVKVYTVGDNVWASVELFFASPEQFKETFSRSISALKAGVQNFVQKMRE
ncbi:MAG: hypothetical protein ACE5H9_03975 [Anaerolineae bacterium]